MRSILLFVSKTLFLITMTGMLCAAYFLFHIKNAVINLEQTTRKMTRIIRQTTEEITALETEWAYLTRPERVRALMQKHAPDLRPLTHDHMVVAPASSYTSP